MSYCSICPQCGTGQGVFYWFDESLMKCDHCGLFVDITNSESAVNNIDNCPGCVLEAIKRKGLWKTVGNVPGKGIYFTDGGAEFVDDEYDSYEEAVEEFDRAVRAKEIDPKKSYITKADGANVEFLRGSFKIMRNMH